MMSILARVFDMNEKQTDRQFLWIDRRCFFNILVALTIYSVLASSEQFEQAKFLKNLQSLLEAIDSLMFMDMHYFDPQFLNKILIFKNKPLVNVFLQHDGIVSGLFYHK